MSDQASSALAFAEALTARSDSWTPSHRASTVVRAYKLQTITPMWGGGVSTGKFDQDFPIRGKSVKSRLVFWWRLLAEAGQLPSQQDADSEWAKAASDSDSKQVWIKTAMQRRFGRGASDNALPSAVRVRAFALCAPVALASHDIDNHGRRRRWNTGNGSLQPSYAWQLLGDVAEPPAREGLKFSVQIETSSIEGCSAEGLLGEMEQALRWWADFGGVGARWRRGAGSIEFVEVPEKFPGTVSEEDVIKCGMKIVFVEHDPDGPSDAVRAWRYAVCALQRFRHVDHKPGSRSLDPDANTLRDWICAVAATSGQEPQVAPYVDQTERLIPGFGHLIHGCWGLPINVQQIKPAHDPSKIVEDHEADFGKVDIQHTSGHAMRSSVILKPRLGPTGDYQAVALRLPQRFVDQALEATVRATWSPRNDRRPNTPRTHVDKPVPLNTGDPAPVWSPSLAAANLKTFDRLERELERELGYRPKLSALNPFNPFEVFLTYFQNHWRYGSW